MSPIPVLIVGAGACGVVAALAARAQGVDVLVLERDALPGGSTALSSGFVPAAGTRVQGRLGIDDSAERFAADIRAKAKGSADPVLTELFAREISVVIDWLTDVHGVAFEVLDGLLYPGHSRARMHTVAERTGQGLLDRLWRAAERLEITLLTRARVTELLLDTHGRPNGVTYVKPDGTLESVTADQIVLACNGYGGNPALVRELIPEMQQALYFGHAGNQGDAITWGRLLDLQMADLAAYQGHGSVAHPHGVLITWAIIMHGGVQVNQAGQRFWDESQGYSEAALAVLSQDGGIAWNLYDERVHQQALPFPDYQLAQRLGAIRSAPTLSELATILRVDQAVLKHEFAHISAAAEQACTDCFGRRFDASQCLQAPFYAVQVTGALFHTQGGLAVDSAMRVKRIGGGVIENLYAAGGAARGVSGHAASGYLSGNGLLAALAGGYLAGRAAATTHVQAVASDHQLR